MGTNQVATRGIEWLSRTIAIVILMAGPGLLGKLADDYFHTRFLAPTGLILGVVLGTTILVLLTNKLTPPARGTPIPFEGEDEDDDAAADAPK